LVVLQRQVVGYFRSKVVEISKDVSVAILMVEDRPEGLRTGVVIPRPGSSHGPLNAAEVTALRYSTI
jgi:hypothetical protein